uniref:Membrane transporter protein n=1 Tax=Tetradesmus obliquus TaxID=3088 RepID=A0A383WPS0_TETOB|eukprot:jgi/Sobl393_1/4636/SZX79263.1
MLLYAFVSGFAVASAADPATSSSSSSVQQHMPNTTRYGHKHLIPLSPNDIGLCVAVACSLFIASGAGVGGGILVVPALLMIGGFGSVDGVGLSNITVLSLAVAALFFQISRRSPVRDAPLIDWDLVMLFGPPSVVGSISGSYINMIIPSWVTKVTLFLLLIPITWRMAWKARTLYRKENAARHAPALPLPTASSSPAAATASHPHGHNPLHRISETYSNLARSSAVIADTYGPDLEFLASSDSGSTEGGKQEEVLPVTQQQQQQQQLKKAVAVASAAVSDADLSPSKDIDILALSQHAAAHPTANLSSDVRAEETEAAAAAAACPGLPQSCWNLRSSSYVHDPARAEQLQQQIAREEAAQLPLLQVGMLGLIVSSVVITNITGGYLVPCGTLRYWLVVLSPLPLMLLVWGVIRQHVLWKADVKRCLGIKQAGDLKWNRRNTIMYPAFCISAGLIAGLLGLGGGLILTPLMLELGVHPAVSVASSQITMLIGNSTSAIVYAVAGAIPWDYGATLITIGFISALLGQIIVSWLVRKLGRSSLIVIVLSCMFTLALGASMTVVVTTMIDISRHPAKLTAHKAVCIR